MNVIAWILQILLVVAFVGAAACKLLGAPMMVQTFQEIGFGQWFRYVTALVELTGAIALLVPGFAFFGAGLLGITMVGATAAHLLRLHSSPAGALVLLVACAASPGSAAPPPDTRTAIGYAMDA